MGRPKKIKTEVNSVRCKLCKDVIYSRATHDFRWCSCSSTFVDGGLDYIRTGSYAGSSKVKKILVAASEDELFNDWNLKINKFGLIKHEKS